MDKELTDLEIDLLIAEKVFKLPKDVIIQAQKAKSEQCYSVAAGWVYPYCKEITWALEAAEKINLFSDDYVTLSRENGIWTVRVYECQFSHHEDLGSASTPAKAIALAVLKQLELEENPPPLPDNYIHTPCGKKALRCKNCKSEFCPNCHGDHEARCSF